MLGLCQPIHSGQPSNVFGRLFRIEFCWQDRTLVFPISAFEWTKCLRLNGKLTYHLSSKSCQAHLDLADPSCTPSHILDLCHDCLCTIYTANTEVLNPA